MNSAENVSVKPLEWVGIEQGPGADIQALPSPYIRYIVRHLSADTFDVILNTDCGSKWFREDGEIHTSYEAAKAAAQADYQQRVLSCLRSPPTEDADRVEPVSWIVFGDDGEPNLTGNEAELKRLYESGIREHALYASPRPETVGVSDAMVARAIEWFDENFNGLPDSRALGTGILTAALSPQEGE